MNTTRTAFALVAILAWSLSHPASAAFLYWDGDTDGDFAVNTNWNTAPDLTGGNPVAPPGAGDTAVINTLYTGSDPVWTQSITPNLILENNASLTASITSFDAVFSSAGQNLSWTLNTGSTLLSNFRVGTATNTGASGNFTLNINGGTTTGNLLFDFNAANVVHHFDITSGSMAYGAKPSALGHPTSVGNTFSLSNGSFTGNGVTSFSGGFTSTFSGGSTSITGATFASDGDAQSWSFSGGSHTLGDVTLSTNGSSDLDFSFLNSGVVSMSTLVGDADGNYSYDFLSGWSGSLSITGNSTLSDYWTSLEGANGFVQLDGSVIDQTVFDANFQIDGTNALTLVPEPGTVLLLSGGLTLVLSGRYSLQDMVLALGDHQGTIERYYLRRMPRAEAEAVFAVLP